MRVVVMLRPTNRRGTKSAYTAYRNQLLSNGFTLVQPEVYIRAVPSRKVASRCMRELRKGVPSTGSICAFCMTERQYERVTYLVGGRGAQEDLVGVRSMVDL